MKFRTDFVTNSSSSCFTLVISIYDTKGKEYSYSITPRNYDGGGEADYRGNLRDLLELDHIGVTSVEELCKYLIQHVDYERMSKKKEDNFVSSVSAGIPSLSEIAKITIEQDCSAHGECADLVPDNDNKLMELADAYMNANGREKESICEELKKYINSSVASRGENTARFGCDYIDFRYHWSGQEKDLPKIIDRVRRGCDLHGVQYREVDYIKKDTAKIAIYDLDGTLYGGIDDEMPRHVEIIPDSKKIAEMWKHERDHVERVETSENGEEKNLEGILRSADGVITLIGWEELLISDLGNPIDIDERVQLVREYDNPYNEAAVAVFHNNRLIGYIPYYCSRFLAPKMDDGESFEGVVVSRNCWDHNDYPLVKFQIRLVDSDGNEVGTAEASVEPIMDLLIEKGTEVLVGDELSVSFETIPFVGKRMLFTNSKGKQIVHEGSRVDYYRRCKLDEYTIVLAEIRKTVYNWIASFALLDSQGKVLLCEEQSREKGLLTDSDFAYEFLNDQDSVNRFEKYKVGKTFELREDSNYTSRYLSIGLFDGNEAVLHLPVKMGLELHDLLSDCPGCYHAEIVTNVPLSNRTKSAKTPILTVLIKNRNGERYNPYSIDYMLAKVEYVEISTSDKKETACIESLSEGARLSFCIDETGENYGDKIALRSEKGIVGHLGTGCDDLADVLLVELPGNPDSLYAVVEDVLPLSQRGPRARNAYLVFSIHKA